LTDGDEQNDAKPNQADSVFFAETPTHCGGKYSTCVC
jgi:hypothetical protein